ncbi:MAG: methyltransferase domain-containing protein [Candidatus Cloacimonetes bacterium]|nr:methyltransferase domain-containing protein [Candidatus Cloacimonadota bacterium]
MDLLDIYQQEIEHRVTSPSGGNIYDFQTKSVHAEASLYSFGCTNLHPYIAQHIAESPNTVSVLDYGCGSGADLLIAAQNHPKLELTGFDPCRQMITQAQSLDAHNTVEFTSKDPFSSKYDLILSNAAIHLLDDQKTIIQQFYDNLKPLGACILGEFVCSSKDIDFPNDHFVDSKTPLLFNNILQQEEFLNHFFDAGFEELEVLDRKIFDPSPNILKTMQNGIDSTVFHQKLKSNQFYIITIKALKKLPETPVGFQCHKCQTVQQDTMYRSLNKQVHKNLYNGLIDQKINISHCTQCNTPQFAAPFQIHDMQKQKMAFCFPKSMEIQSKQLHNEIITPYKKRLPHYEMQLFFTPDSFVTFL